MGTYHSCAITNGGNVKCWGRGGYGQLGNGSTTETNKYPVSVHKSSGDNSALDGITAISLGSAFSCALTDGGNVKCWGVGDYGQLGDGMTDQKTTPVNVRTSATESAALSGITAISVGFNMLVP